MSSNKAVFTVVAKNYMASAISLVKSIKTFHKDVDCYIVLCDEWDNCDIPEGYVFLEADKLGIKNFKTMAFMYDVVELSTAIKPYVIQYLFKSYEEVIYLDPDIWLLQNITRVWELLSKYGCVLTPHIVDDSIISSNHKESHILNNGVFNLGFLAVRREKEIVSFIDWWAEQLQTECIRSEKLFVDQKWINYVPCFCDNYYVLKDKSYNISDWNYIERSIGKKDNMYTVREKTGVESPIVFFHFSQIKQQSPEVYLKSINFQGNSDEMKVLSELIVEYEQELKQNGFDYWHRQSYVYNYYKDGTVISLIHRRLFRQRVMQGELIKDPFFDKNTIFAEKHNNSKARRHKFAKFIIKKMIRKLVKQSNNNKYSKILDKIHYLSDVNNQLFWFED